ncbi:MAG TPA: DUF5666 domain-containing protein [Candidatus Angelobacter sp.]|nr:DUF5666 domain-containing protein [Candidatus Angelobacter sp.]
MRNRLLVAALLSASFVAAMAQVQERGGRNMPPGENVMGKVTAVSNDSLTVSPIGGGDAVTVKISDSTRVMKERQAAKLEDIKTDDTIFARGKLNANVMDAAIVGVLNPQMVERMQQGGGMMGGFNPADMGKKFIAGRVTAINETKLTIARPDGQSQDIEVDENTSFKKGAESITLPDIKVGDFVHGRGELKDGVFVPKELIVGRPQMRIMMGGPGGPAEEVKKPENAAPAVSAPAAPPK